MKNVIKLASEIQYDSVVDGVGLRQVIWTQGCPHHCLNCHNRETWDFAGGVNVYVDDVVDQILKRKYHTGVTFSGGEPMAQARQCALIAKEIKENSKMNIWTYTGYLFEDLIKLNNKEINEFLKYIDVLVDGTFKEELKSLDCKFRGSKNQRLIDVQKSLIEERTILLEI